MLATTEIHKIPATVLSRCQRLEFRRLPVDEIVAHLRHIAKVEKLKVDDGALNAIARQATGSMRDAISLLDQLASTGKAIDLELAQSVLGTAASQSVLDLIDAIRDRQPPAGMQALARALDSGADPRSLARQLVDYLRGLLLIQLGNPEQVQMPEEIMKHMVAHAGAFPTASVLRMLRAFNAVAADTRGGWQPSLGLELALAEALAENAHAPAGKPQELYRQSTTKKPVREKMKSEASTPAQETAVSLNGVTRSWGEIRKTLKPEHPGIEGLLNSSRPLEIRGDTLVLGFQSETVRALMDVPEKIAVAQQGIADVLGVELKIQCVVTNAKGQLPPDVNPDGMVATAIRNGGEIAEE